MDRRASISIALATYNGAKYLRQQLADLARQSLLPAELVVCDDQSSDDSVAIIEEFAASAPFPVHLHRNPERLGYRANFIKCAGLCNSDLIAFCDQDDRWDRRKLELLAAPFRDEEVLLAYHNARVVTDAGRRLPLLYRGRKNERIQPLEIGPWFNPMGFTQMFRRSLIGFDDLWPSSSDPNQAGEPLAHDQWYVLLASVFGSIAYVPNVLADYRQHGGNTYGMSWYRSLAPSLTELWHATHDADERLVAAEGRAALFGELSHRLAGQWAERARNGADWYGRVAALICKRAGIYNERSLPARFRALRGMARAQGYGSESGRFPPLTRALDSTIGVAGLFRTTERVLRLLARR